MSDREIVVACPCPGTPHTEDTVVLYDRLPLRAGMACYAILQNALRIEEVTGMWAEQLVRMGIESWTLTDAQGKALPVLPIHTEGLPFATQRTIGTAAMERFGGELTAPLPTMTAPSSNAGPTGRSMSANRSSGRSRPAHSKRSLPNGSAGRPSVAQVP